MALEINGETHVLRLTLGALAELENALEEPSLIALVERFEGNRFSSRDVPASWHAAERASSGTLGR